MTNIFHQATHSPMIDRAGAAKIRLCFVIRSLGVGGSERQLLQLLRELDTQRFEIHLITFYPSRYDAAIAAFNENGGIALHCIHKRGRWDFIASLVRLKGLLLRLRPDVVQSTLSVSNVICAALVMLGVRTHLIWGVRNSDMPNHLYGVIERIVWMVERALSSVPNVIVVNSERGKDWVILQRGFPSEKVKVIPNAVCAEQFSYAPAGRRHAREAWGVQDSHYVIGIVGRIDPVKGHRDFLAMAARLSARLQEARFVIVGEQREPLTTALKMEARKLQIEARLIWQPHVDSLSAVYSGLDLLCLCSLSEGFPNVVAEARASGLRVVGYDVGDARDIAGVNSEFVPVGDIVQLSASVEKVYQSFGQSRDEGGAETMRTRFSIEKLKQNYENLYLGVANHIV